MHFNPYTKQCNWPEKAGCLVTTSLPVTSSHLPTNSSPPETSSSSLPASLTTTTSISPPSCVCFEPNGIFPHPMDCTLYCYCENYEAYEWKCPSGLYYNPSKRICDSPESAGCDVTTSTSMSTSSKFMLDSWFLFIRKSKGHLLLIY